MKKKNIFLAIISIILLFQIPANAQKRWIGAINSNWNNPANWLPAGVPGNTTDITIEEGSITPAFNALSNCNITAGATCRNIVGINNLNFSFVIGANTLTATGDVTSSGGFGESLFTMSATSTVVINGNFNDGGFLLDSPLGTIRFEGGATSTISLNPSLFGNMTINKTGIAIPVIIDATNLSSFVSITLQSGTLQTGAPALGIFVAKLNIITGNSAISVAGASASDLLVTNVEVFGGTCTIDPTDQLAVFGNWTQSGTGTVVQTATTKFISFRGTTNSIVSSTVANPVDIQANVQILKTGVAPNNKVTITQATVVGTIAANKNLVVQTGVLELGMPINTPITVNGNIDLISTGVLNALSSQTVINVTGNFNSNTSTVVALPGPFLTPSNDSTIIFSGTTNSTINVNNVTVFDNINVNKSGPTVTVTPIAPSVIRIDNNLSIGAGTFRAINAINTTTAVNTISAINNPLTRSAPKQLIPPSGFSALTIGGATGEIINIPDADIIVGKNVTIQGLSSLDLGTNEPQGNDANTIAIHIGQNIVDNNNQMASNGAALATTVDANNAGFGVNPGLPRGLYIGLSTTKPMGQRSVCTNTNGPVSYAVGLSPRSNYEIPTIVFFGTDNGSMIGNVTNLPDLCNNFSQGNGLILPNVILNKTNTNPATPHATNMDIPALQNLKINGNLTIVKGTFNMNSRLLLFGDYSGKGGSAAANLAEDDKIEVFGIFDMVVGSTLLMNTGAEERGTIIRVRKGGFFKTVGTSAAPNKITREGTPGQYYRFAIYNGGGIASFRTEHTFMSWRSDEDALAISPSTTASTLANSLADETITQCPNYDLLPTDSNVATETGPGSGHGWVNSRGGLKVLWGAIVNPFNTGTPDLDFGTADHNFSYGTFGSGGPSATSLTINTGQELDIIGTFFGNNSGANSRNIVANTRVYFNNPASTDPANVNIITLKGTSGPIGGSAGEQFDGGKNDEDIAPLFDLIKWETYTFIYWVGNYNLTTVAVPATAATPFTPAIPAQPAQPFRNAAGEGVGSVLEFIAGTGTVNEIHTGSSTAWSNPKNWSLSNRSYYNPYQIYPGQATPPNGFPKRPNSPVMLPFGTPGSTVPSDTLEKYEVWITRTAPTNPTMDVSGITIDGSLTVNSGNFKDFSVYQIRIANSYDSEGIWRRRMGRIDIIPQVANAQNGGGLNKIFTIPTATNFTVGGDLQVQVNGVTNVVGTGNLFVKGNIETLANLPASGQQLPGSLVTGLNPNTNAFLNPTEIGLTAGTTVPATVLDLNQLNFNGTGTLTLNGIGTQQIRVARNPLHNIVVSKLSGEVRVQGLNASERTKMNLTGNLTVQGGKFTMLSTCPLLVNGNVVLNSTVSPTEFTFNSSAVTVRGNWTNNGCIVNSGTGRINFHPNTTTTRTIRTNGEEFPTVHFGFFDDLINSDDNFHLDGLPENYPANTPSNPSGASPATVVGATTYTIQDNFTATGLTTIYNNRTVTTLVGGTVQLKMSGVKILSGATLDLAEGAELLMDSSPSSPLFSRNSVIGNINVQAGKTRTLLVQEGGTLDAVGTASRFVKISRNGTVGNYRFIVEGTIRAQFFLFEFMDQRGVDLSGLTLAAEGAGVTGNVLQLTSPKDGSVVSLSSGTTVIPAGTGIIGDANGDGVPDAGARGATTNISATLGSFSDGIFTNGSALANATYLRLPDNYPVVSPVFIERTNFPLALTGAGGSNVSRRNSGGAGTTITDFRFSSGIFAGEPFDDEDSPTIPGPNGNLRWVDNIKRWDGRTTAGVATGNSNWFNASNWEGDAVPAATDEIRLDYLGPNLDPAYAAGTRNYIVDANVVGGTNCQSLTILPRLTPTPVRPITLNVVTPLAVGGASGGDFSAAISTTINVIAGANITVAGSWSNDGVFNSGGAGTVIFAPSTGTRVIKAGADTPKNNAFFNVVFATGTSELNSTLFVDNNLTINTLATLDAGIANTRIELEGDWANANLFNPRFGVVVFTGTKPQTITKTGTPTFESYWDLKVAKGDIISATPLPSTTDVTLNSRVLVGESSGVRGGNLFLVNGKFISNTVGNRQMILTEKTNWTRSISSPSSPNTSAFVEGPLGRIFTSNSSQEERSFPVGKGVKYLAGSSDGDPKVKLALIMNAAVRTTYTVEQINGNPEITPAFDPSNLYDRLKPTGINQISYNRWWDVKNIEFPATAATAGDIVTGEITLPFVAADEEPTLFPLVLFGTTYTNLDFALTTQTSIIQDFDVAFDTPLNARGVPNTAATNTQARRGFAPQEGDVWKDLGGIFDLASSSVGITSSVNFKTLGNGQFTFGWFFVPLPVELVDLKAEVAGEKVRVSWITVSEKNNDYFIVEKSIDAKSFEEVGRVPAKISPSALNNYEIFDANPYQAINYYRLKQFDKNGKYTYSKIISVKMGKTSATNLSIYPNPTTNNEFVVDLKGTDLAGAQLTVTDMLGKTVYSTKIDQNGASQTIRPNTTLAAGMYIVTVQTNDKVYQQRLSVK